MVEVTKKNFEEIFPEIEQRIKNCLFVCLDAEYTGIHAVEIKDSNSLFDTPAKRYTKMRKNLTQFSISQMGLAIYERDPDGNGYIVNAYNFFVFPVSFDTFAKRELITMQVSCLNFLTRNNFDFNKFIREGVPYLNREKAISLHKYLSINRHFMNTCEYLDKSYFPMKKEFLTDEDITKMISQLEGFSKVMKLIQKSKKPVVGHNMLLDLTLMYSQFCEELPVSYVEFKKNLHEMFPSIYDTKSIAWGVNLLRQHHFADDKVLTDTNLFALYSNTSFLLMHSLKPFITPVNETVVYREALQLGILKNLQTVSVADCHSAAFDATVTGAVFLKLGYLACRPQDVPEYKQGLPPTMTEIFKRVSHWKDQVNISRCIVSNIHLSKPDPESRRPDWIRVRSTPGKTVVDAMWLRAQLSKYGDIEIEVVGPEEVLIACSGIGCAKKVWKNLEEKGFRLSKEKNSILSSDFWTLPLKITVGVSLAVGLFVYYRKH